MLKKKVEKLDYNIYILKNMKLFNLNYYALNIKIIRTNLLFIYILIKI